MAKGIEVLFNLVDAITEKVSKPIRLLVFFMMCVTTFEVVARYVFNRPTSWAWPINRQLFCFFILVAGVYTMSINEHIKIEIFYDLFPPKMKLVSRMLSIAGLILFIGVLIWQSAWMGWNSMTIREVNSGVFRIPLYPIKLLFPICSFLFLLQGIVVFCRRRNGKKTEQRE